MTSNTEGWTCDCKIGVEVYPCPSGEEPQTPEGWAEWLEDADPLTHESELQPGTKVMFQSLFGGLVVAKVIEVGDGDGVRLMADSGGSIYNLTFDADDRHCWTSSTGYNKTLFHKKEE